MISLQTGSKTDVMMINRLTPARIQANEVKGSKLAPWGTFPHSPVRVQCVKASSLKKIPPQVKVVQSDVESSTEFLSSRPVEGGCGGGLTPGGGVSCAKPGGRSGRSCVHSRGTGTVWLPCACGSVSSARLNGRTSTCSLPTCTCMVSHLYVQRKHRVISGKGL